ncbi:MAG: HAD-IB family phosphatase [Candidatus Saganbacteria bacterium]|nr:HAD-IB family phosphatase [Candidatus Saganbacteria bacterium]
MIKLVTFDVDDTLTLGRSIWEQFYIEIGTWDKIGKKFLSMFKRKKITFDQFMQMDAGAYAGNHERMIHFAIQKLILIGGIKETIYGLNKRGIKTAIVSGTIGQLAFYLKEKFNFDFCYANPLIADEDGILTGEIQMRVPPMKKDITMRHLKKLLGLNKEEVLAIGDSELDFNMFDEAGYSICVQHAPAVVKKRVNYVLPDNNLIYLLKLVEKLNSKKTVELVH